MAQVAFFHTFYPLPDENLIRSNDDTQVWLTLTPLISHLKKSHLRQRAKKKQPLWASQAQHNPIVSVLSYYIQVPCKKTDVLVLTVNADVKQSPAALDWVWNTSGWNCCSVRVWQYWQLSPLSHLLGSPHSSLCFTEGHGRALQEQNTAPLKNVWK